MTCVNQLRSVLKIYVPELLGSWGGNLNVNQFLLSIFQYLLHPNLKKKSAYEPLSKTTLSHLIIIIKKLYNLKCLTLTYRAYF